MKALLFWRSFKLNTLLETFLFNWHNCKTQKSETEPPVLSFSLLNCWKEPMSWSRWMSTPQISLPGSRWLPNSRAGTFKTSLQLVSKVLVRRHCSTVQRPQCHPSWSTLIQPSSLTWLLSQSRLLSNKLFSVSSTPSSRSISLRLMDKALLKVSWSRVTPSKLSRLINKCQLKSRTLKSLVLISTSTNSDSSWVSKFWLMIQKILRRSDKRNVMSWKKESEKFLNLELTSLSPAWVSTIWHQSTWLKQAVLVWEESAKAISKELPNWLEPQLSAQWQLQRANKSSTHHIWVNVKKLLNKLSVITISSFSRAAKSPMPVPSSWEVLMNTCLMKLRGKFLLLWQIITWFNLRCQENSWIGKGCCWWRSCWCCFEHLPRPILQRI